MSENIDLAASMAERKREIAELRARVEDVERLCALLLTPLSDSGREELRKMLAPISGDELVQALYARLWPDRK